MRRRHFLAAAASGFAPLPSKALFGDTADDEVTEVHVIFKTHLDVGFTGTAAGVIDTYFTQFIPAVLSLCEQRRRDGSPDRYIWTTGSWLVYNFLEAASSENRRRMEQAIGAGDFVWHGLPFTTHTELIDPTLFRLGLEWSARLDRRFGRQTIAAKMTDVPGHTRGIVPLAAGAGIRLLHIGVNSASRPPDVPPLFVWRSPDSSGLIVMYAKEYGSVSILPGGRQAVSVSFTGDNHGPHTPDQIAGIYSGLRKRFPGARVFASDFNAVAREVLEARAQLPVLTQELGDTWIHGPGSDPLRMAEFRELSRLRREWIGAGRLAANSDADLAFGGRLLRIAEHTWGLDIKTFLKHWDAYEMPAFRAARKLPEFREVEASWNEKRAYIGEAAGTLSPELATEARGRLKILREVRVSREDVQEVKDPGEVFETPHFRIGFDRATGAIRTLRHRKSNRDWAGPDHLLGLFSYQTFSKPDFDRFLDQYITQKVDWALGDFGKPGLENTSARSETHQAAMRKLRSLERTDGRLFVSEMAIPQAGDSGCPKRLALEAFLPAGRAEVVLTLRCAEKPASRLPEALWLSFVPPVSSQARIEMDKMGQSVSPLDVIRDGNRNLHGIIGGVNWRDGRDTLRLESSDAFLVAPGRRTLLVFDNRQPDVADGMHFCLCNNVWGTNFSMWFEDDMLYRFVLKC